MLIHADVYRTGTLDEVTDLALAELVEEDAVALVEWGELAAPVLGDSALEITLVAPDPLGAPERRVLTLVGRGRWADRSDVAAALLEGAGGRDVSDAPRAMVAIETATETVGVAVRTAAGVQAELTLTGRRRHVETLTPALEHLLAQLDLVPGDLGVVGVDVGPGLFTGLRVGVAAAKGLAQALGIGVVGATSLDILTAGAAAAGLRGLVLACVDARRGEVFATVHEVDVAGAVPGVRLPVGLFAPAGPRRRPGRVRRRDRCTPWATAPCAMPTPCGPCPGPIPRRLAWPSRPRRRCSIWCGHGSTRENRQSSPRRSFPSTCARRTRRATSPVR